MKKIVLINILISHLIFFYSCYSDLTVQRNINNIIPYDAQQLIKSIKSTDVDYRYIGNPKGDKVKLLYYKFAGNYYMETNINSPLSSLIKELMETKFEKINPNSPNKVIIKLVNVYLKEFYLGLEVETTIIVNDKENIKLNSYGTIVKEVGDNSIQAENIIHELLLKFVIATDKFIDTQFDIQ